MNDRSVQEIGASRCIQCGWRILPGHDVHTAEVDTYSFESRQGKGRGGRTGRKVVGRRHADCSALPERVAAYREALSKDGWDAEAAGRIRSAPSGFDESIGGGP